MVGHQWCAKEYTITVSIVFFGLCPKKTTLTVWWVSTGIIHYHFLKPGETIMTVKCCKETDSMQPKFPAKQPILVNRKGPIFLNSNGPSSSSKLKLLTMLVFMVKIVDIACLHDWNCWQFLSSWLKFLTILVFMVKTVDSASLRGWNCWQCSWLKLLRVLAFIVKIVAMVVFMVKIVDSSRLRDWRLKLLTMLVLMVKTVDNASLRD